MWLTVGKLLKVVSNYRHLKNDKKRSDCFSVLCYMFMLFLWLLMLKGQFNLEKYIT